MRIRSIRVADTPPISLFEAQNLSDVVVIAGRNGIGKTRLVQAIVSWFRTRTTNVQLVLEATCQEERASWRKEILETSNAQDVQLLHQTLFKARRRSRWQSGVLQFESDRTITQISHFAFTWDVTDPFDEMLNWDQTFQGLAQRFTDMIHSIFRKVRSHRDAIARDAEDAHRRGEATMNLDWQDPLLPFKSAFGQLLAPKELLGVDFQQQTLEYLPEPGSQQRLSITTLSSGEREVLNVVFDFLLRNPEDCIILFDEPELHLHPELSYKLIQTLRSVGARNQFIFCTHSPDIITASLDQSVVFVTPPSPNRRNQALPVSEQDNTNQALKLLGQSVGIIALGKKLVLIEGTESSLDKQTYGSLLQDRYPDLVLVPAGGKGLISSFAQLKREVLDRTLWGVEFFMLCDRDAVPYTVAPSDLEQSSSGRLRVLTRYHLENFFLDSGVLARIFARLEPLNSTLRDASAIEAKLRELASGLTSYAAALTVAAHFRAAAGNVDITPKGAHDMSASQLANALRQKALNESARVSTSLDADGVADLAMKVHDDIQNRLKSGADDWKVVVPGRPLFSQFARFANMQSGRLKHAYIVEARESHPSPFADIYSIFKEFSGMEIV